MSFASRGMSYHHQKLSSSPVPGGSLLMGSGAHHGNVDDDAGGLDYRIGRTEHHPHHHLKLDSGKASQSDKRRNLEESLQQMPFEDLYELTQCCENEMIARRLSRRRHQQSPFRHDHGAEEKYGESGFVVEGKQEFSDQDLNPHQKIHDFQRFYRKVTLNVGGTIFCTSADNLCREPGSLFSSLLAQLGDLGKGQTDHHPHGSPNEIFIDRSPLLFGRIVDFLRGDRTIVEDLNEVDLKRLHREAEYYGLWRLEALVKARLHPERPNRAGDEGQGTANEYPHSAQSAE